MGRADRLPSQLMLGSLGTWLLSPELPERGAQLWPLDRGGGGHPGSRPSSAWQSQKVFHSLRRGDSVTGYKDAEMSWEMQDLSCWDTPLHGLPHQSQSRGPRCSIAHTGLSTRQPRLDPARL